jgi:hypothetical protein
MLNKILLGTLFITASGMANAGLVFNNDITGADMAGIEVTVGFTGGGFESSFWSVYSTDLGTSGNNVIDHEGFSGGATGTGWSLSQSGFTLGNIGLDSTVYGLWSFADSSNTVSTITINTGSTGIVFDTQTLNDLSEDTNGSGQGKAFVTGTPAEVTATYSDPELQELYNTLTLDLTTAGTEFEFLADTDLQQEDDGTSEVVLVQNDVVDVANEEVLNEAIEAAGPAAAELEGDLAVVSNEAEAQTAIDAAATAGNEVAAAIQDNPELVAAVAADPTILSAAANTDITNLPAVIENPITSEEIATNLRNAQILEIIEDVIAEEIRSGTGGSTVSGNGDINVEIAVDTGEVTFGLSVLDENSTEAVVFTNLIDTPDQVFTLDFNLLFESITGSLTLSLENSFNELFDITYLAADYQDFSTVSWLINDSRFFGLTDAKLTYSLFPGSPASALISNINVSFLQDTTEVSAPSTISILMLSIFGFVMNARRKQA